MQKLDGTTIKLNRGDVLKMSLSIDMNDGSKYQFKAGDKVTFSIYDKGKMSNEAVLIKVIEPTQLSEYLNIELSNEETKLGSFINKPVEYWYEIELNDEYTVIGYDEDGAKKLMLYPEGNKDE